MERSLSIILFVRNVQSQLRAAVEQALDAALDLTTRFDLLIVDNASTDATPEVAEQLARRYRQARVLRSSYLRGHAELLEWALAKTAGEMVLVHDGHGPVDVLDIDRLWRLQNEPELILARPAHRSPQPSSKLADDSFVAGPKSAFSVDVSTRQGGFYMLCRTRFARLRRDQPLTARADGVRLRRDMTGPLLSRIEQRKFFLQLRHSAIAASGRAAAMDSPIELAECNDGN